MMSPSSTARVARVLICDDDPIVRDALTGYLSREPDFTVTASVDNAEDALRAVDLVLMDLALPGMDGITATRTLRGLPAAPVVLVLTTFGTDEQVQAAIAAGAAGFLLKTTTSAALVAALRAALAGAGTVITPELASHLSRSPFGSAAAQVDVRDSDAAEELGLTAREIDVLELLCAAESNAGIADALNLSESTVKTHVSSLMAKLECSSRLHVAVRAFERGLVVPPRPRGDVDHR
ncbi:response regulator transcription factor [Brachybacterium sp. EF45031]|uniref:response regulator transcription factor n=1 Tax=Brachybacterium sillae TaxID=2810536 RepID=UPI00217D0B83|nr:response regulator transcription factor [Brachybacterium sillae]MCS6712217.1 response regulator transcription factor [Brachybacterium sillae]